MENNGKSPFVNGKTDYKWACSIALLTSPEGNSLFLLAQFQKPEPSKDDNLPIFFAGDALREPFWPMGEGCAVAHWKKISQVVIYVDRHR